MRNLNACPLCGNIMIRIGKADKESWCCFSNPCHIILPEEGKRYLENKMPWEEICLNMALREKKVNFAKKKQ